MTEPRRDAYGHPVNPDSTTLTGLVVLGVAALVVLLAARSGWRNGASRLVFALLGTAAGVYVAFDVAAWIDQRWPQTGWYDLALVAGTVLVLAVVGGSLGSAIGGGLSSVLRKVHLQFLDRIAGAVVRGGLAVVVCALAISLFSPGGPPGDGWTGPRVGPAVDQVRDTVGGAVEVVAGR